MKNILFLMMATLLISSCAKDSSGEGSGTRALDNNPPGSFEALTPQKMTELGLKETDFSPDYSKQSSLDSRVTVGAVERANISTQLKNGATVNGQINYVATKVTSTEIEITENYTATTSVFSGAFSGSEVRSCRIITENNWNKLDCQTTSKQEPQIPPEAMEQMKQAAYCNIEYDSDSTQPNMKPEYGFYTLNGVKLKAVKYITTSSGTVRCSDNTVLGHGAGTGVFISTAELPNVSHPDSRSTSLLFSYGDVTLDSGAVVTKSRYEYVR